ncbi:hypothetical protein JHK87_041142 [Glycine soja]|nr:hypothetical protein JHK87_041142 [Glycine soja]
MKRIFNSIFSSSNLPKKDALSQLGANSVSQGKVNLAGGTSTMVIYATVPVELRQLNMIRIRYDYTLFFKNILAAFDNWTNFGGQICSILCKEPNCVEINCQGEDSRVIVLGDIHGQFHDLMFIFKHEGVPSENQIYVFNGNCVHKGAWGIEVFLVLLAWKVLMAHRIYLLRGNHESRYCTARYGFKKEVWAKYGDQGEDVYNEFLVCFKELPLASVIVDCVYTTRRTFP